MIILTFGNFNSPVLHLGEVRELSKERTRGDPLLTLVTWMQVLIDILAQLTTPSMQNYIKLKVI